MDRITSHVSNIVHEPPPSFVVQDEELVCSGSTAAAQWDSLQDPLDSSLLQYEKLQLLAAADEERKSRRVAHWHSTTRNDVGSWLPLPLQVNTIAWNRRNVIDSVLPTSCWKS
jgi:hypothetical protein